MALVPALVLLLQLSPSCKGVSPATCGNPSSGSCTPSKASANHRDLTQDLHRLGLSALVNELGVLGRRPSDLANVCSSVREKLQLSLTQHRDQDEWKKILNAAIRVMKTYPDSIAVQSECSGVLTAANEDDGPRRRLISKLGGIKVLAASMKRHPATYLVQGAGCVNFQNLAAYEPDREKIVRVGGVRHILHALTSSHARRGQLVTWCLGALSNLVSQGDRPAGDVVEEIKDAEGIKLIIDRMAEHPLETLAQRAGCVVLATMASFSLETSSEIVRLGGITASIAALKRRRKDPALQGQCFTALQALSSAREGARSMLSDSIEVVKGIVAHPSNIEVRETGLWTLNNVVSHLRAEAARRLASLGVLDLAKRAASEGSEPGQRLLHTLQSVEDEEDL